MFTDIYSWHLVPENLDPAGPHFDRLIAHIDRTVGDLERGLLGGLQEEFKHGFLGVSAFLRNAGEFDQDTLFFPGSYGWTPFSLYQFAPVRATFRARAGFNTVINFRTEIGWEQHCTTTHFRCIVNPGSINITGDSSWLLGAAGLTEHPHWTTTASLTSGLYQANIDISNGGAADGGYYLDAWNYCELFVHHYQRG